MRKLLVTGSSGLIGSEACLYFAAEGWEIHGIDNNQRAVFFGPAGDTRWNQQRLERTIKGFVHHELDIRDRQGVLGLMKELKPDAVVHTAAQPSHDLAASIPFADFDTNAVGTLNLLEAARQHAPGSARSSSMSHQQGVRRCSQRTSAQGAGDALGICRRGLLERHPGDFPHRPIEALDLRRFKGGCGRDGAGIRPLLWICQPARCAAAA